MVVVESSGEPYQVPRRVSDPIHSRRSTRSGSFGSKRRLCVAECAGLRIVRNPDPTVQSDDWYDRTEDGRRTSRGPRWKRKRGGGKGGGFLGWEGESDRTICVRGVI